MTTRMDRTTDHYEQLGVTPAATEAEIGRAFRALAKDLHPDRTRDPAAEERFKELAAAYAVLGDPERRARYDRLRAAPPSDLPARRRTVDADEPRVVVVPEEHRPISVRALPEAKHGRWAYTAGIVLVVAGIVAAGLTIWLMTSESGAANGSGGDTLARDLTFWLITVKLVVVGTVFVVLGRRRRRYP